MKKIIVILFAVFSFLTATAQTNIQEMYDFNRKQMTTTLESFTPDKYGSTFFFVDIYHKFDQVMPTDFYTEISRSINFWQDTKLKDLSAHVEYNGGCGIFNTDNGFGGYPVNNAWLVGADYFLHSDDYNNTLNLSVLYKNIRKGHSQVPMQFTMVWGMKDLFGAKGLSFSGFADFWWEDQQYGDEMTKVVFLSEPQIWYNIWDKLYVGGELECSYNFSGNVNHQKGWEFNPVIGLKYNL